MPTAVLQPPSSPPAEEGSLIQKIVLPGQTDLGEHILSVLHKRTYDITPNGVCVRAEADRKIIPGDVHYDDPMNSSVKFESDFVPFKLATDVVLHGRAYAPYGKHVTTLIASLAVGAYRKELLVIGDRLAHFNAGADPTFGDPEPFETMELRYERAYGGVDIHSEKMQGAYPRNDMGRGYVVANTRRGVSDLALPNIEDPANHLTPANLCVGNFQHWERQPMPQGFGWTAKSWLPRAGYAGTMPADRALEKQLRKTYATLVPPKLRKIYEEAKTPLMDFRFFNGASLGLIVPFLSGAEPVKLSNLDPRGNFEFRLPGERPRISIDIGPGQQEPLVVLQTVMIRMDERQVDLLWRGAIPYGGPDSLTNLKKMEVQIS